MNLNQLDLFKSFIDISQDLMVALDRDGSVVYINPKGCEILKQEESKIIGCNWFDCFYDKNLNEEVKSVYLDLINGNTEFSEHFENSITNSEGANIMFSWHNKALYDAKGNISFVLSAGRDVSAQEECESKLSQATLALSLVVDRAQSNSQ